MYSNLLCQNRNTAPKPPANDKEPGAGSKIAAAIIVAVTLWAGDAFADRRCTIGSHNRLAVQQHLDDAKRNWIPENSTIEIVIKALLSGHGFPAQNHSTNSRFKHGLSISISSNRVQVKLPTSAQLSLSHSYCRFCDLYEKEVLFSAKTIGLIYKRCPTWIDYAGESPCGTWNIYQTKLADSVPVDRRAGEPRQNVGNGNAMRHQTNARMPAIKPRSGAVAF